MLVMLVMLVILGVRRLTLVKGLRNFAVAKVPRCLPRRITLGVMCLCIHASCIVPGRASTSSKQKRERRASQPAKRLSDHSIQASVQAASHVYRKLGQGRSRPLLCYASVDQQLSTTSRPKVVGLGSVGLDYLAQVAKFPKPDEKLRTEKMEVLYEEKFCTECTAGVVTAA